MKKPKKRKHYSQRIPLPVLRSGVQVWYDYEYEKQNVNAIAFCETFDNKMPSIFLNANNPIAITSMSHEALHAVRNVLNTRGFNGIDLYSDEALPYYHSYILGQMLKFCDKNKIKLVYNE